MSSRQLPARPHLDHLKHEAKALHHAFAAGDPDALRRVAESLGERRTIKLTDAQRVLAREYGFPTWARLRSHVQASGSLDAAVDALLDAVQAQDLERVRAVLRANPRVGAANLHAAAVLGLADDAERLLHEDATRVHERRGSFGAEPLLYLCYSPLHAESAERDAGLLATARVLLDAGADPNARDTRYGVPALYAVTGPRSVLPLARLLLERGANPTDGESIFHAAEQFHEDAMELLLRAGTDLNYVGDWGNTAIYFLLRWHDVEREPRVGQGVRWLLRHGADPNIACGHERETSLHLAARRGQDAAVVRLLVEHGADLTARRGDGRSAWLLAARGGHDAVAALLREVGAPEEPLSATDQLMAACGRGDANLARRLATPEVIARLDAADRMLLPEAASLGRESTVRACLAAGLPVDVRDSGEATALHHAALHGRAALVRDLLAAGAETGLRDSEHSSTPLGWAFFGADHVNTRGGDYPAVVRALLGAGARPMEVDYVPKHAGVREVLGKL